MSSNIYRIGDISRKTGFSVETLRYYEKEKLIKPVGRTASGYRLYNNDIFSVLELIQHLKVLGFSLSEIRELHTLCDSGNAFKRDIKQKAQDKLVKINEKLAILQSVKHQLEQAINLCPGDDTDVRACPILHTVGV